MESGGGSSVHGDVSVGASGGSDSASGLFHSEFVFLLFMFVTLVMMFLCLSSLGCCSVLFGYFCQSFRKTHSSPEADILHR